jgi:hypothetical protein
MCCVAEKSVPQRSGEAYSRGFFQSQNWKRLQDKAEEYFSGTSHGKFKFSKYLAAENKQVVLISVSGVTDITSEFKDLAKQWKEDTLYSSSLEEISFHPAYQTIMAMGEKVLPLIFRELNKQFGHWFYALAHIAREDAANGAQNLEDARQRWLDWGRKKKLL